MFWNLFKFNRQAPAQRAAQPAKMVEVRNPFVGTTVSVDEELAPLVEALWARKYDVMHCSRDTKTDEVTIGFATNGCASQFLSVVVFMGPGGTNGQLLDDILQSTGGWTCSAFVRLIAVVPGYQQKQTPAPPIYIDVLVQFHGRHLNHVLQAVQATKGGAHP